MARRHTQIIPETDCIGDSLDLRINPNFLNLDEAVQSLSAYDGSLKAAITPSGTNLIVANNLTTNNLVCSNNLTVSNSLTALNGDVKIGIGRTIRKIVTQVDSATYSTNTTWALGPSFPSISNFKAGSLVRLFYHMPCRNDSASWGGGYIEPQVSFNEGASYYSLGSSGYDGGVMHLGNADIGSYFNTILIDPQLTLDFSVRFRFYFKSYDGTVTINGSHDINNISGMASLGLMSGVNGTQHFAKIVVEELY